MNTRFVSPALCCINRVFTSGAMVERQCDILAFWISCHYTWGTRVFLVIYLKLRRYGEPSNSPSPVMTTSGPPRASSITANHLRQIANGEFTSPKAIAATLSNALKAKDYSVCLKNLQGIGIEPQLFIDGMDKVGSGLSFPLTILTRQRFNFRR